MGMKCIECGTDNTLRDRTTHASRCKSCNHTFAFEPSIFKDYRSNLTDAFFAKAIADISANDTLYFTPKQLLYLVDKRLIRTTSNSPTVLLAPGIVLVIFGLLSIASGGFVLLGIGGIWVFLTGASIFTKPRNTPQSLSITQSQLRVWINRWQAINGTVVKMLPSPREELRQTSFSDVSAYSFDRVVICDRAEIAQLLIANNFHFENNCAVLSITGYPQSIFTTVMEMLRRNPDLKVYALHDASPQGVKLVHQLRTSPDWFQNSNVAIFDLGLLPRQILASRNMFVRTSYESVQDARLLPEAVRQGLAPNELKWFEDGNFVELESFTPQRIIRVLNQGIAQSQNLQSNDSLVLVDDGHYESGGYVFTADTFG